MGDIKIPADILIAFSVGAVIAFVISYFFCSLINRNRSERRYYDDDYHRGGPRTYSWLFFLFLVGGGLMAVNLSSKGKIAGEQTSLHKQWMGQPDMPTPVSNTPISDYGYVPESPDEEMPAGDIKLDAPSSLYYIQEHVLFNSEGIQRCIEALMNRGLPVDTQSRENGTAILIGPYPDEETANWVKSDQKLKGIVLEMAF